MLCNLWSSCWIGKCLIIFGNCFIVNDIDWMWVPSVYILGYEFVKHAFKAPVTHKILLELNLDVWCACHNHNRFKSTSWIYLINWLLLYSITGSSFNCSLQRRFSPWVMHSYIADWLPFLLLVIICQNIPRELVHKYMKSFIQLFEHFRFHSLFNSSERATFLTTINNRNVFWFHSAVVCYLCQSTTSTKYQLVCYFALVKQHGQLTRFLLPWKNSCRHIKDNKIQVIKPFCWVFITKLIFFFN